MKTSRGLNERFMDDLLGAKKTGDPMSGCLNALLTAVVTDDTLSLEIRDNYINVYYRGGSLFKVTQKPTNQPSYDFYFDKKYIDANLEKLFPIPKELQPHPQQYDDFVKNIPIYKRHMDFYLSNKSNKEKDVQQQIAHENNMSIIANDTDYFIIDIEYADSANNSRFDMVAVQWPSTGIARKTTDDLMLSLIEVKYGDGAIRTRQSSSGTAKNTPGLKKHMDDIESFLKKPGVFKTFAEEMERVLNQKIKLGLYRVLSARKAADPDYRISISKESNEAELIFILVNHKPASTLLEKELVEMTKPFPIPVKIATASYMGYGLYNDSILDLEEYLNIKSCAKKD